MYTRKENTWITKRYHQNKYYIYHQDISPYEKITPIRKEYRYLFV